MDTPESSEYELTGKVGNSHAIVRRSWQSGPGTDLWGDAHPCGAGDHRLAAGRDRVASRRSRKDHLQPEGEAAYRVQPVAGSAPGCLQEVARGGYRPRWDAAPARRRMPCPAHGERLGTGGGRRGASEDRYYLRGPVVGGYGGLPGAGQGQERQASAGGRDLT